ncbi:hypothetical protein PV327_003844 [Microctonus hyperodae]|uniref:Glucosylceramidase n=1 Tax=Microctonus hyperodae TaxID=165561 RepID=A0AA39L1L7_MICHY|nr:hypothetical protein PV327_003844 [Microctonus hyperodae]
MSICCNMATTQIIVIFSLFILISHAQDCIPRYFGDGKMVCVCNSTYCDFVEVNVPDKGKFRTYKSSRSGERFKTEVSNFDTGIQNENGIVLELNLGKTYQSIFGFGGAFTDAAGININKLSKETQEMILQTYYGSNGSRYNLGRVPIGGTDFSTRTYTLDDTPGDTDLSSFSLANEDINYKIPYMKRALELNPEIKFFAASWTAPPWMKTNNNYTGFLGFLKQQCYQTYSNYLVKFLETYKNNGLPIHAISTGNEPADVFAPWVPINDMGWTPSSLSNFVAQYLGPTVANSLSNETLIWVLDDQRVFLPWFIVDMFADSSEVDKYIGGIAVHWYADNIVPPSVFDETHKLYPDIPIIMTEACSGSEVWELQKVKLGSWSRGENYMFSIIEDMNHWVTGWVDWNLALDKKGGPNWSKNFVDSPIIVNPETDEFFKNPMYYALAHFSKFIPRKSTRVDLTTNDNIKSVAFSTPENRTVVILLNQNEQSKNIVIVDPNQGHINTEVSGRSFQTIIYQQ